MSLVRIEKVETYFGQNHLLKNAGLEVEAGEFVSVISRSGSGTSTLLRRVNALQTYGAGRTAVDGMERRQR